MTEQRTVVTATTDALLCMAEDSVGRNRSFEVEKLRERIDGKGIHVVAFQMIHNDNEYRTLWMVKMQESMDPVNIWLDTSMPLFDGATRLLDLTALHGEDPCLS